MNVVFGFCVADRHDSHTQKAGGVEALLAVVIAGIFLGDRRPVEYLLCIGEVKAVFIQVDVRLVAFQVKFMGFLLYI